MLTIRAYAPQFLAPLIDLWNRALISAYGFFPLTQEIFLNHVVAAPHFVGENFRLGFCDNQLIGFVHYDVVDVVPYARAGVISALVVSPEYRRKNFGSELLANAISLLQKREKVTMIDAGGAWPYSSFYVGLIDGSERAGIAENNLAARRLFRKHGFFETRASLIMRADLSADAAAAETPPAPFQNGQLYHYPRGDENTWLDVAFRFWEPFNWQCRQRDEIISQATYARMRGFAEYCGREIYSIYGVHTTMPFRRHGAARENLVALKNYLAHHGAQILELQVYADNLPARKLYESLGFTTTGKTFVTRRR